jgi:hypothetical protein
MNKEKLTEGFILSTMIGLYVIVSIISTLHVIEFFEMSNPRWLAISLAVAFEIGAAASLASIIVLEKTSKTLVWSLFILLTAMQMQGNMFYAYSHLENFQDWIDLFGLQEEELIVQKRILSFVSGAILPIIALGFIKSLVDYLKPENPSKESSEIVISEHKKDEPLIESEISEEPVSETVEVEQPIELPMSEETKPIEEKKEFIAAVKELTSESVENNDNRRVGNLVIKPETVPAENKHFYKP